MRPSSLALGVTLALVLAGCAQEPGEGPTPGVTATTPATPSPADPSSPSPAAPPAQQAGSCEATLPAAEPDWTAENPRVRVETTLGTFVAEVALEQAPVTGANFLKLVRSGFYDGTQVHRVVPGFVIQGGDPLSKDANPDNDGTGDAGYEIPDEFHPALRHDAAGVLSMANSGPNTGSSQFFVTLGATPHLDDRHAVFGRVVEGLDVVQAIGETRTDPDDRPLEPVTLLSLREVEPHPFEASHAVDLHVVVPAKKAEPGRGARFAVVLQNEGNVRDALALTASPPEGWTCSADGALTVPAGTGRVAFLTLTPPASASGTVSVPVGVAAASGERASASVDLTIAELGPPVKMGNRVTANYAGLLPDGRLFDTSMTSVGTDPEQPKFDTRGGWQARPSYNTFPFTVGSGVIPGFTNLALTAKVGETVTSYIPAKDAYATGNVYERPLTGRDLVFELEIVKVG